MNTKKLTPVIIAILVFGGIYYYAKGVNTGTSTQNSNEQLKNTNTVMTDETKMDSDGLMDSEDSMEKDVAGATYLNYSSDAATQAISEGKKPVLFFHASWCPTCRALENELQSGGLEELSSDIVLIKTDYDTELELRQKYGITIQHTLVQVDEQGNEVAKWTGGGVSTIQDRVI